MQLVSRRRWSTPSSEVIMQSDFMFDQCLTFLKSVTDSFGIILIDLVRDIATENASAPSKNMINVLETLDVQIKVVEEVHKGSLIKLGSEIKNRKKSGELVIAPKDVKLDLINSVIRLLKIMMRSWR